MNDKHTDLVDGLGDKVPVVGAEAASLVPVVAEADGTIVGNGVIPGDHIDAGEVIAYVQTDEDA